MQYTGPDSRRRSQEEDSRRRSQEEVVEDCHCNTNSSASMVRYTAGGRGVVTLGVLTGVVLVDS